MLHILCAKYSITEICYVKTSIYFVQAIYIYELIYFSPESCDIASISDKETKIYKG